ncbi:DEAD/DEAH box helicase [Paracoccus aestuariivivens]|uniref:Uncharacterized protein n=1 Tax=Paracoccus aestuariivivens TaxID=1820333 RepID=A0A6L6JKB3_9RHOB|nr:pentapeptide repeat-containing protein [Paracoccus aestuariivivens]MTH80321.1 hypothetical protein [Paracoccus aestuariivivens]
MANSFDLNDEQKRVLVDIMSYDGADFSVLVGVAGLDPSVDLRGADIRDVDFGHSNLDGYDFSYADISGCRFDRAKLKGAIFAYNRDEGTVWPRPQSERRSARVGLYATRDFDLLPFQREAVSNIVAALEQGVPRPLVSVPAGAGREKLLEALLSELDRRDMVDVALVCVPTQVGVERMRHRFSDTFGPDAVSSSTKTPTNARLIVASSPRDPGAARKSHFIHTLNGVSHIFILDGALPARVLRDIQLNSPSLQIVSFSTPGMTERIDEGEIIFRVSYQQAVEEELLERSEIHNHRLPYRVENAEKEEMEQIVSEVLEVVSKIPTAATLGVVCPNTNSLREISRTLQERMNFPARRIVHYSSANADESLVRVALDLPGTLLLMTNVVAVDFDWAELDYVIVLTRLRSPERLAFIPRRPNHRQSLQVIDFMRNFDRIDVWNL